MNTEIIMITDRSGSMSSIEKATVAGFNSFIDEQRGVPGEARVTSVLFDDYFEMAYQALPLPQVPHLHSIGPRGMTALRDAIGRAMEEQGRRIAAEGWAQKVIVCILTDGHENASRKYTSTRIYQMITHAREHGWEFVFLGANIDAFAVGQQYGISQEHTYSFAANAAGTQAAYANMSLSTRKLRGATF